MSFPNTSDALWDFTSPVQFQIVNTAIADYEVTETPNNAVVFDGVLEPINPRKLLVKPENQRRWKWWTLWSSFVLTPGQIVQDDSRSQFRVMSVQDWRNGGHLEYELVQDPPLAALVPVVGS